jgi:hypothetical protein
MTPLKLFQRGQWPRGNFAWNFGIVSQFRKKNFVRKIRVVSAGSMTPWKFQQGQWLFSLERELQVESRKEGSKISIYLNNKMSVTSNAPKKRYFICSSIFFWQIFKLNFFGRNLSLQQVIIFEINRKFPNFYTHLILNIWKKNWTLFSYFSYVWVPKTHFRIGRRDKNEKCLLDTIIDTPRKPNKLHR